MRFILKADFEFEAENIGNAFEKLRDHFQDLVDGKDTDLIEIGSIDIQKKEKT